MLSYYVVINRLQNGGPRKAERIYFRSRSDEV